MTERWVAVPGYEGAYEVSDLGRVRSLRRRVWTMSRWGHMVRTTVPERILKASNSGGPYMRVNLCADGRRDFRSVARMVLEAFEGPCPVGEEARHLNGVSADNRLINLAYGTPKQNAEDRDSHGTTKRGEGSPRAVLSEDDVRRIRENAQSLRQVDLADEFGVCQSHISKIQRGGVWSHVE